MPQWQWWAIAGAIAAMMIVATIANPQSWSYAMFSGQCSAKNPPEVCHTRGRAGSSVHSL